MDVIPKCYITYCQEDCSKENMKIIVKWMRELCNNKIEFLFDGDVKNTESFDDFEKRIYDVEAILIFFSPNYKKRCLDENDTGVYREYRKILYLYEENKRLQQSDPAAYIKNRVLLYSILYKGKKDQSITPEFTLQNYVDISESSKFCEDKNHNIMLTSYFINLNSQKITDILREIMTSAIEKTNTYISNYDKMLKELFINTKSEHINLPDDLFIETNAYNSIIKQQKYLLVGRKGSGKTTVKNTIVNITGNKYKGIISIIADQFAIDETYHLLFNNEKMNSDIDNCFSKIDTYKLLWSAFINIYCIFIVYKEYLINSLSNIEQLKHITSLEKTIIDIFLRKDRILSLKDEEITKTIYFYVLTNLETFIDYIIKNSRNDVRYYKTDIKSFYTPDEFLRYLIGNDTYNDFYYILQFCNKKIFITLDGFDVNFEIFKKTTVKIDNLNEKKKRIEFENLWLMIFIETLIELRSHSKLDKIVDLCLTLPVDRIESIKANNRDFYKYHSNTVALSWKCNDLVNLITKRLYYLNEIKLQNNLFLDDTNLSYAMNKYYPNIPSTIQLERNGYINMPLFLYILRKSFWRPRDIIRYYGCILSLSRSQKDLNDVSIKRAIKDESMRIIQDEFLGEFSSLYTNLREIINLFDSKKQILSYKELYDILKNNDIIIDGNTIESDFVKKLKILYIIGFIGIKPSKEFIELQFLHDEYAFIFTEGTSVLRILESEEKQQSKYVIHPIFTEYLFLKVDYNNLICNYTWDYAKSINCSNIDYVMFED